MSKVIYNQAYLGEYGAYHGTLRENFKVEYTMRAWHDSMITYRTYFQIAVF